MRKMLGPLLLIVIILAGLTWLRFHHQAPALPQTSAVTPSAGPTTAPPIKVTSIQTSTPPTPTPSISATRPRPLAGRPLAAAWLTGYLTRSSRSDNRWVAAVTRFTSRELLYDLEASGPEAVGLDQLTSWRVVKVEPYRPVDQPVDTPSRMTLAYAAVVTDGRRSVEKPFLLTCYVQPNGRWLVTSVEQPYSSEG